MAFGFTPDYREEVYPLRFSHHQFLALAVESAEKCGWIFVAVNEKGFNAVLHNNLMKRNSQITFKIEGEKATIISESIGSEMYDWGRNRKNISAFLRHFNKLKYELSAGFLEEKYDNLKPAFIQEVNYKEPALTGMDKINNFYSFFIPVKGFFVTPLLIDINILIFLVMIISGVHFVIPDNESLVLWGANFRPVTIDGGWWRLLSSIFVHIGAFHLLMNMYALVYIGSLLEPRIGSVRFAVAYVVTGIAASCVSLWWHSSTISAGASGAIFGMYGVFLALLTTNLIEKSIRKPMLISIGVFVGYNLLAGMKQGIDNAAHIGGLLSGIVIGFSLYYILSGKSNKMRSSFFSAAVYPAIAAVCLFLVSDLSDPLGEYDRSIKQFSIHEEKALQFYNHLSYQSDEQLMLFIQNTSLPNLRRCRIIVMHLDSLDDLPQSLRSNIVSLKEYCDLRIESFELMYKAISSNSVQYNEQINSIDGKIEVILRKLKGENIEEEKPVKRPVVTHIKEIPEDILYVIDGKPIIGRPEIEPAKMAEILFLDSAHATQLYGDKGKNGAFIVTLK